MWGGGKLDEPSTRDEARGIPEAPVEASAEAPNGPSAREPSRLERELEDGALRRAMGFAPLPQPAPDSLHPVEFEARLVFNGQGGEYFRIWVVNVFFTLLTLGVYSAWAKVRKARWFAQHTSLMGDRFDFHGRPWRILLGRVLAVGLLVAWSYSFDVSPWLGMAVLLLLCVVGPLLFAGAQRFRFANTSWRGLRFAFDVPTAHVYVVCVPMLLFWALGTVLEGLGVPRGTIVGVLVVALCALPAAHARLKQLQHSHTSFGGQHFSFKTVAVEFYGLYLSAAVLAIVGAALAAPFGYLFLQATTEPGEPAPVLFGKIAGGAGALLAWFFAWPYFAARVQQLVWSHTAWGRVRFRGELKGLQLWRLLLGQVTLVLLTAGLYWPFAAVAIARLRLQSIVVEADGPIAELVAVAPPPDEDHASGDATADFFGLDLGW